jgi:hypothetical protein
MAEWSTGDWHEDMVALYADDTDTLVCWLQKKGGVETKDIRLIEAAPELLEALADLMALYDSEQVAIEGDPRDGTDPAVVSARKAINKAKGGAR